MSIKKYLPIIISLVIIIVGIFTCINIYAHWADKTVSTSDTFVEKIKKDDQKEQNLKSIIHESEKSVVQIEGKTKYGSVTGSGFVYNDMGDIITNAHVVEDADAIYVRTSDARFYPAAIVGLNSARDIAVVRVPQLADEEFIQVNNESRAETGDDIIALGSPHGFQNTVTLGIISGVNRNFNIDNYTYDNVYQISAQITHGNSGGPLIDKNSGKAIGINSVGTEDGTIGFSIPIIDVIDEIKTWSQEAKTEDLEFDNISEIITSKNEERIKEDATYLANYFLESILIRDYVGAYSLLNSQSQSNLSYTDFRENFVHITDLSYKEPKTKIRDNKNIKTTVDVSITHRVKDKEDTKTEKYTYTFISNYENDQLKIETFKKEKQD